MKITFIGHSGFLVELDEAHLVFDWAEGNLPALNKEKPAFVFISHAHGDHYNKNIFSYFENEGMLEKTEFFLGEDTEAPFGSIAEKHLARCRMMRGEEIFESTEAPKIKIETLFSTDAGVAFIVTLGGKTIFHAGDLVWWDWTQDGGIYDPEEARKEAEETARDFKKKIEPLRGRHLDLAMIPLDPRLGGTTDWTIEAYDELADIDVIIPMHQWNNYECTAEFIKKHPEIAKRMVQIVNKKEEKDETEKKA